MAGMGSARQSLRESTMRYQKRMSIGLQVSCALPAFAFGLYARWIFVNVVEYRNLTAVILLVSVLTADSVWKIVQIYRKRGRVWLDLVKDEIGEMTE